MSTSTQMRLEPRKRPTQRRSHATVSAMLEACIQVLLAVGYQRLTTTRVAERAGVSVGTLYQYFPNKQALVSAAAGRHLDAVVAAVSQSCAEVKGKRLEVVVSGLVDAFVAAKLKHVAASVALYQTSADAKSALLVRRASEKAIHLVAGVLGACPDSPAVAPVLAATNIVAASSAVIQAALERDGKQVQAEDLRRHLKAMLLGYLTAIRGAAGADVGQAAISSAAGMRST
jgi:AcrR family transcriptional regulator